MASVRLQLIAKDAASSDYFRQTPEKNTFSSYLLCYITMGCHSTNVSELRSDDNDSKFVRSISCTKFKRLEICKDHLVSSYFQFVVHNHSMLSGHTTQMTLKSVSRLVKCKAVCTRSYSKETDWSRELPARYW
jgi:hypothetical protein